MVVGVLGAPIGNHLAGGGSFPGLSSLQLSHGGEVDALLE